MNKIASLVAVGLVSMASSQLAMAHGSHFVTGTDGNYAKSSNGNCVIFGSGVKGSDCHAKHEEPAPAVVEEAPAPEPVAVTESFTLSGDALFETNSSDLTSAGKASLNEFIAKATGTEGLTIESITVTGHADSRGSDAYNQTLSEKRADTVGYYLGANGIDYSKVTTLGAGETQPVASNDTAAGRAQNRRVELEVSGFTTK